MKIYLACTVRGDRAAIPVVREIMERLAFLGHEVVTAHLQRDDVEQLEAQLTDRDVYERDVRWLESCDAIVAEASGSSYGVGFEVGYVLGRAAENRQRAFVLYDQRRAGSISRLITGNTHPHCTACGYSDLAGVRDFIDRHFTSSQCAVGSLE